MQNDWPTQSKDMEAAAAIITKHRDLNDDEPLHLIEITIDRQKTMPLEIKISDWVKELIDYFEEQYGAEQGQTIVSKVITRFMLRGETIH